MEDIKEYLNDDASEEERRAADQISEGLAALRRQESVNAAANERAHWSRKRLLWLLLTLLLTTATVISYWQWSATENEATPNLIEEPIIQEQLQTPPEQNRPENIQEVAPTIEESTEEVQQPTEPPPPPENMPIAQAEPTIELAPPPYGAPDTYLRGQQQARENKALLDQLWYTSYPLQGLETGENLTSVDQLLRERNFSRAYVGLQRLERQSELNDTLRYLQAYTLLEMGQGTEARLLLDQLESPPQDWQAQLQWYRGLAALLADHESVAMDIFRSLAVQSDHPYRLQAKKALELFE